jgi:type I restriction enzyme, S subunit
MIFNKVPFKSLLSSIVDNRGKTCPTTQNGIPLIATNCVKNINIYPSYEKVRYVSEETYNNWFRAHPKPGDLIFVTKGSPGEVCLAPDPVDFCIAQDMVAIRADESIVYPNYLFAALRAKQTQKGILSLHVGTMIPHFKKGDFDKLMIPLPDYSTQKSIGDFYKAVSIKIDNNQRMNETLEKMARAIFKSWFVDFDPIHTKAAGKTPAHMSAETATLFPTSFGDNGLPVGWKFGTYGDVMSIHDSKRVPLSKSQRERTQGMFPYYGATSCMDYIDKYLFDGVYLLMGEDGSVVRENGTPFLQYVWGKFWVNNHAHVLQGANGFSTEHLFCGLSLVKVTPYVTGAVQLKINQANMKQIPIVIPTRPILKAFNDIILPFFDKRRSNIEENQYLIQLRDTLLPKLMSGEICVKNAEREVEVAV